MRHTIYYKNIPIADYCTINDIKPRDPHEIFINNIDRFDSPEEADAFVRTIFSNLFSFIKGNLPEGIRYQSLAEQTGGTDILSMAASLDEFSGDISIDRCDTRRFSGVPEIIRSGDKINNIIALSEYRFTSSERASGSRPSSFAGYFDKFTAVLEDTQEGVVLRESDWREEVGNVIVKPQGDRFPYIAVNEAFCTGLAGKCGLEVPRVWLVYADDGWSWKKHFVTERFGVHSSENGSIVRDLIFDTGILLGDTVLDNYSISSEDYFDFMRSLLSDEDMQRFMDAYLYGFLIGNSDMHVKNFSVRQVGSGYTLTPIYDMVSYKPYGMRADIALSIGSRNNITSQTFMEFITQQGMPIQRAYNLCNTVMYHFEDAAQDCIDMDDVGERRLYNHILEYAERRCSEIMGLCLPRPYQNAHEELGTDDLRNC